MGVRGLTTYINNNEDHLLRRHLLRDTRIIIDGYSLCAQLYHLLNSFSAFGGDYDKYASFTRNFFKSLRKCNIAPFVLFDGSYESKKLKTAYYRLRSKIHGASRLDPVTQGSLQIFPLLLRDVFKEVLIDMNVPYTVCEFEADDEIAAMARYLNCPVLSYDSDFFIYNVLYIPFRTLELKPKQITENNSKVFAIECKIYEVKYLVSHVGDLKEELLPLLATLLGNDYVEKKVFNKFFSQLKMPKSKTNKSEQQRCINGVFKWLQNETLDSAVAKIIGRLKKAQKDKVLAIITKSIEGYNKKYCRSLKYFDICDNDTGTNKKTDVIEDAQQVKRNQLSHYDETSTPKVSMNHDDITCLSCDSIEDTSSQSDSSDDESNIECNIKGMPDWFAEGIRNFSIPQTYINLFTHHLHFCFPQAEDYSQDDSFLCTLPILRYAFDLITDFEHEYCIYVSRESNCSYKRINIGKEYSVARPLNISFSELSNIQKKLCFKHFLQTKLPALNLSLIEMLPSNFQLYMISILWLVANCNVNLSSLHSLFLTYVMLEVIDEKTGSYRGHFQFTKQYAQKIAELKQLPSSSDIKNVDFESLFLNKNKVHYEDCLIACDIFLKYFDLDDGIKKKPKSYDAKKMHTIAQFQCCLQQINSLNILCGCPFNSTKYCKFNGTFAYNASLKFEGQDDPYNFLANQIKGANTVLLFFKSLLIIYEKCADEMALSVEKWVGKKRRRRRGNKHDQLLTFIMKGFESEVVI